MSEALSTPLQSLKNVRLIGLGVAIESMRRKEAWVLLILMAAFAAGVLVVKLAGVDDESTATMLLNLGLSFAYLAAHTLALLTAARQFPDELESRTIYPLLAKPLARRDYLLGKWLATGAIGAGAYFVFLALVGVAWTFMPHGRELSGPLLAQTIGLHVVSLFVLTATALCGSVVLPKAVNLVGVSLLFLAGGKLIALLKAQALGTALYGVARWDTAYIPHFGLFNLVNRYTDGVDPLEWTQMGGLLLYATILTAVFLLAGAKLLARRAL